MDSAQSGLWAWGKVCRRKPAHAPEQPVLGGADPTPSGCHVIAPQESLSRGGKAKKTVYSFQFDRLWGGEGLRNCVSNFTEKMVPPFTFPLSYSDTKVFWGRGPTYQKHGITEVLVVSLVKLEGMHTRIWDETKWRGRGRAMQGSKNEGQRVWVCCMNYIWTDTKWIDAKSILKNISQFSKKSYHWHWNETLRAWGRNRNLVLSTISCT